MSEPASQDAALDEYIRNLVETVYGDELDKDAKQEARNDLSKAFIQLFNARLMDQFNDQQLDSVGALLKENKVDEITKLAYNSGINLSVLTMEVMQEFQQLYAPDIGSTK